jgi:hypothetical protein
MAILRSTARTNRRSSRSAVAMGILAMAFLLAASPVAAGTEDHLDHDSLGGLLAGVRQATAQYHDLSRATAAGYGKFYVCTDQPGQGAMGQHFVNGALVADPEENALTPEAVIYEPEADGEYRLVAVEYVTFQAAWDAIHASPPVLFGEQFHLVAAPNRYGLPAFYELHLWIWRNNPSGLFNDWNPRVSCRDA